MVRQTSVGDAGSGAGVHELSATSANVVARAAPGSSRWSKIMGRLLPYVFLAPALGMLLLVYGGPSIATVVLSFSDWDGVSRHFNFIGLDNFAAILGDSEA